MRVSTIALLGFPLLTAMSAAAMAANVNQPYQNVDRTNDKGNDTGDSKVESLNGAQSGQAVISRPAPRPRQPSHQASRRPHDIGIIALGS